MAGNSYNDEKHMDNELCQQGEFEGNINSEDINHGSLDAEPYQSGGHDCNSATGAQLDTEMAYENLALETVDKTISQEVSNLTNNTKEESDYQSDRNADKIQSEATNVDKILAAEHSNLEAVNGKLPEGHTEVAVEDPVSRSESITISQEIPRLLNTPKEEPKSQYDKVAGNIQSKSNFKKKLLRKDLQLVEANGKLPEVVDGSAGSVRMESDTINKDENRRGTI